MVKRILVGEEYYRDLIENIKLASNEIYMAIYVMKYNTSDGSGKLHQIFQEIEKKAKEGVIVTINLNAAGIDKRVVDGARKMINHICKSAVLNVWGKNQLHHEKVVVIDQHVAYIGSHNLTGSSLRSRFEVTVKIEKKNIKDTILNKQNNGG